MIPKNYIIIAMIITLILIVYHANVFNNKKEFLDSTNNIKIPQYENIDNLDVKQMKEIIEKQKEIISEYVGKIEKNNKRYHTTVIQPNEDVEQYFKELRQINDETIEMNKYEENMLNKNKEVLVIVKRYLEDPLMRGYNIYESEQYSKLLDIGNIKVDNTTQLPKPLHWSINLN